MPFCWFCHEALLGHITIILKIELDTSEDCRKIKRLFNKPVCQITDKLCKTRIIGNQIDLLLFILTIMLKVVNITSRLPIIACETAISTDFSELFSLKRIYVKYKNAILSLIDSFFRI